MYHLSIKRKYQVLRLRRAGHHWPTCVVKKGYGYGWEGCREGRKESVDGIIEYEVKTRVLGVKGRAEQVE